MSTTAASARSLGCAGCEVCGLVVRLPVPAGAAFCPRCGERLHSRLPASLERTWALTIAALLLYIPANLLPVMTTNTPLGAVSDTIMQGVVELWSPTSWPLAVVVFVASVTIPLGKLIALAYLLLTVQRGSVRSNGQRVRLYRLLKFIGRWSMLDVFVDTFVVALIQLQPLMWVEPGAGVLYFAAVVVVTMVAVNSFDPRLIWDLPQQEKHAHG
ncbi:paraquat-inducible protein A [Accumulibacter sp.]|uniref:paraquat-inducible protein A n=1 Tax=Accumulibacter sp. TaxID=2053492 RepID=UPI0025E69920|nr:paraquat-inducible protein A [Accumulibacter sp.]MCM8611941.1 paraquat-inducible protein A [Accumulibacter sp.]MCM8635563.1 paraquat-inducible protein A [Accumulibacter sp.]MCM8639141.1 paraquat-inducible protein A [Accumulibacter sp.]